MTFEPHLAPEQPADWEAFYRDYRKPGYIEGFEITTKLGGGMFGLVFRAKRMSIGKDYAIKFLKVEDGDVRRAVLSELEQVKYFAQIDHPNLVSIEDRGEVSGIPYLVMAFAGTETLRDRMPVDALGVGRIPDAAEKDELLRAFLQSCRGLQALHERSLVHFDIKPANVFLKGGVARLGDYGLSKLVTHSRGSLSMGRGTPYYMAPEMLKRRGDARSDIYSLGVMLYEILCGKVPFAGDSEWEVLKKHETAQPELPNFLTANERAALQRCLHKDPERRFQSVQELIVTLGAPTSTAAAAYRDVREGARIPPLRSPGEGAQPAGAPPPPPLAQRGKVDENPYREMADASRKAFRHASEVARKAMQEASANARKLALEANQKWRESWSRSRQHGVRSWRARTQLRKQKRKDERATALRVASAIAKPGGGKSASDRKSPLRRWAAIAGVLAALVMVLVVFVAWAAAHSSRSRVRFSRTGSSSVAMKPAEPSSAEAAKLANLDDKPVYRSSMVPTELSSLVSSEEPRWAALRAYQPEQSKQLLLQHIQRLRQGAPMSPVQRVAVDLPVFECRPNLPREMAIRDQIAVFTVQRGYDSTLASNIAKKGPPALALVAKTMTELDCSQPQDLEKARRLQRLMVAATACKDLDLVTSGSPDHLRTANQALGRLWQWFVNEFAHTERSWYVYQKSLRI